MLSLRRAGFAALLNAASVGDTIRIADAAHLFRSVADILALRLVLVRRGLHLRVESGLLSGIDLASDDPGTKMMVSVLAAVLEFQRDMISENTREGVAAAEASGKTLGRPAAVSAGAAGRIVAAYRDGTAVKALARQHDVAPRTIRRVLDAAGARAPDQNPNGLVDGVGDDRAAAADRLEITLDVPGLIADPARHRRRRSPGGPGRRADRPSRPGAFGPAVGPGHPAPRRAGAKRRPGRRRTG